VLGSKFCNWQLRRTRPGVIGVAVAAVALCALAGAPRAGATTGSKTVRYHGYRLEIPRSWPVFRLSASSHVCVRFNRNALYLGVPGTEQSCPAETLGRTEAILVEPTAASAKSGDGARGPLAPPVVSGADVSGGSMARIVSPTHGLTITATWRNQPAVIERALGVRTLIKLAAESRVRPAPYRAGVGQARRASPGTAGTPTPPAGSGAASPSGPASSAATPATPGEVYAGLGFDLCSTPTASQMTSWSSSYQAIGIYIGGANMACSQPNLTGSWVAQMSSAGWHLLPIYVGLQSPSNSCGCESISPSSASSEGQAAAADAVAQAQALGIGPGNPIYYDMEAYTSGSTNTPAVLAFVEAWTQQLHADAYESGVYSSDDSGIADLVSEVGTGYLEPDDIWIASWNGEETTADSNVPTGDWSEGQRIHQYDGGHNETHGGVTLNIDSDDLDGATAAAGGAEVASAPPVSTAPPTISGLAVVGQALTDGHAIWSGAPTSYAYQWEICDTAGADCTPIPGATTANLVLGEAELGDTVRVLEAATNALGTSSAASSAATGEVVAAPGLGYWVFTAEGDVLGVAGAASFGSDGDGKVASVTGMSPTPDGLGYWLVDSAGKVFPHGDAASFRAVTPERPVIGIVGAPGGGYWLFTAHGNVYNVGGAPFYGSPVRAKVASMSGMAVTPDGRGYWLVDSAGKVFRYGDAANYPAVKPTHPVIGIIAAPGHGYWLLTAYGNLYNLGGAPFYGSPARAHIAVSSITGMAASPDGRGYWLVDSAGKVFPYGDAGRFPALSAGHPVLGIVR